MKVLLQEAAEYIQHSENNPFSVLKTERTPYKKEKLVESLVSGMLLNKSNDSFKLIHLRGDHHPAQSHEDVRHSDALIGKMLLKWL